MNERVVAKKKNKDMTILVIRVNKERQRTLRTNKMREMYASCQTEEDFNQILSLFQLHVKTHTGSLLSAMELPGLNKPSVIRFAIEEPDDLYHFKEL